jgi:transketolase
MSAIMNGLSISGFLPVGATFLVFSDYMKPSIRLSCLMQQQIIYVLTHDSIGLGEDGPTHQPIEHLAGLRALPNMRLFRPADYIETKESWRMALSYKNGPSILALTRQSVNQIVSHKNSQNICSKGAYILSGNAEKVDDIAIFASGSELSLALLVKDILTSKGLTIKVISVLCFELFFIQDSSYIQNILSSGKLKVAIEASTSLGWHKIIGENGIFFGIDQFGHSAPASDLYQYFGLTAENIAEKIIIRINKEK